MSTSLLPEAEIWSPGYVVGALFGWASALLCTALINRVMAAPSTAAKEPTPLPMLSRRERAEKMLAEMRAQRTGGASSTQGDGRTTATSAAAATAAPESSGGSSSSWASTGEESDDDSDEEDEEEVDSEYERMEDMRLKMVFVFRHPVQPKITPQEVAVLTASAGVQLVEQHQQREDSAAPLSSSSQPVQSVATTASPAPEVSFTPDKEDRQRWRHWYLWWNRIGCAKITLRCPDKAAMDAVAASAWEMRLPVVQLHRSQFRTLDGVMVQGGVAPVGGEGVVLMALGPAPSDVLEPVTGALKLFS